MSNRRTMSRINPLALFFIFVIVFFGSATVTWLTFGNMQAVPGSLALLLWLVAAVCAVAGWWLRKVIQGQHGVGLARGQVHPMSIARWVVIAQAVAYSGIVCAGIYSGIVLYLVVEYARLSAASAELPITAIAALGGLAMTGAGWYLERGCLTPPPTDASPA